MLYICPKFCRSNSKGFRVTNLNSRVDARVVANVDGQTYGRTYGRTNGRKTGSLYRAMPEAGATKTNKSSVSEADRAIPSLESTDNARKLDKLGFLNQHRRTMIDSICL